MAMSVVGNVRHVADEYRRFIALSGERLANDQLQRPRTLSISSGCTEASK